MSLTTTTLASSLKNQLDEIDEKTRSEVYSGFYESRLKIEVGMWQKGKVVCDFRGVNPQTSYYELEKVTERNHESLKDWNDLFEKYQDYDRFLKKHAEPMAKAWAEKVLRPRRLLTEVEIPALPKGSFTIIYADPPWRYEFSETDSRAIEAHYPSLDTDKICGLKIPTDEDAVLFLWSPAPKINEALTVLQAWNFQYLTHLVWVKDKIGMGYWVRNQHELLLIGRKGTALVPREEVRYASVFNAPRLEHSAKPPVVYEMIESMFPEQKYIELFHRGKPRPGWVAWGNEVEQ